MKLFFLILLMTSGNWCLEGALFLRRALWLVCVWLHPWEQCLCDSTLVSKRHRLFSMAFSGQLYQRGSRETLTMPEHGQILRFLQSFTMVTTARLAIEFGAACSRGNRRAKVWSSRPLSEVGKTHSWRADRVDKMGFRGVIMQTHRMDWSSSRKCLGMKSGVLAESPRHHEIWDIFEPCEKRSRSRGTWLLGARGS
jgi:hypothetical protein